jgi:hypothetical protein
MFIPSLQGLHYIGYIPGEVYVTNFDRLVAARSWSDSGSCCCSGIFAPFTSRGMTSTFLFSAAVISTLTKSFELPGQRHKEASDNGD